MATTSSIRFRPPVLIFVLLTVVQLQVHYFGCRASSSTAHDVHVGKSHSSSNVAAIRSNLTVSECTDSAEGCLIADLTEMEFQVDSYASRRILQLVKRAPLTFGTPHHDSAVCSGGDGSSSNCVNRRNGHFSDQPQNAYYFQKINAN